MLFSVLALSVGVAASPFAAAKTAPSAAGVVVYLGCQVGSAALSDCQVVNDEPVDAGVASVAIHLAQTMSLPAGFAERNAGRVVVKLTVKR